MEVWKIREGLYQSSKIDDPKLFESFEFNAVIDLEGGFDEIEKKDLIYLYFHFYDAPYLPSIKKLRVVSNFGFCLWRSGARVLVHCSQGRNRSSLVNGVILNLLGFPGGEAADIITRARPGALSNPMFRIYVNSLR